MAADSGPGPAPGFVDLHCHGGAGAAFDDASPEGIAAALALHAAHGTQHVVLSLVSAPVAILAQRLRVLRELVPALPPAVGIHLEGPFLAPGRAGAHDPAALTHPDAALVDALIEAGGPALRIVTLAPELPGALDAIGRFVDAGVVVAVGHTEAGYDLAAAAFDRGASLLTHAFNAMPGLGHREPGPVGAALRREHAVLEVIADGHHLHDAVIATLFAAAPGRIALVTDAMAAAGGPDGRYVLGARDVEVRGGVARLAGTDTLAGSTLTLDRAIERAVGAGVAREAALAAATLTPARVLGLTSPRYSVPARRDR
ncbi:amidohydrolase family protein [Microbacterium sp. X-17]|uniref:N-acetylglucosamine-6-phosphate deacetylase n=1 Tax=Microbacterium sp. X-17 TaxID=3144404 RepID=UPI0031F50F83